MKKTLIIIVAVLTFNLGLGIFGLKLGSLFAQGDTIIVQTITYADITPHWGGTCYHYVPDSGAFHQIDSVYYLGGTYLFPSDTFSFEKILMNLKLKCVPGNNPACGQWDNIEYIYAYKDTNRYELGRYETPFGINMNLGAGFTWTYDVSDFSTILFDSVGIRYLGPQNGNMLHELVDLQFIFIKGIPPRDVIKIQNLDGGEYRYGDPGDPMESHLQPITINLLPDVQTTKIRATVSGDGWGGSTGCAEFCRKHHWMDVDGVTRFNWYVWKNDCSLNPMYPQGGTWIYNRANRCPGEPDITDEFELTPYVTDSSVTLQYHVQPYVYPQDEDFWPCYTLETQLVSYGAPNFTLDAAVWDIKAPSKADVYKRMNPVCTNPLITIKNTGSTSLTSLTITYGIEGGTQTVYNWTGNLPFTKTEDVTLPSFIWSTGNKFIVTVSNPNGSADQYPNNNSMKSDYVMTPEYPNTLIFDLKTDLHYQQYGSKQGSYTIKDENGNLVWERPNNLASSTTYKDTLNLTTGCYEFRFTDDWGVTNPNGPDAAYYNQGDGMTNWPDQTNVSGHMYIRRESNGAILKNFNMDFGHEMYMQFSVGYTALPEYTYEEIIKVYPNPSNGIFNLDMSFTEPQDVSVLIYDIMGRKVYDKTLRNVWIEINSIDLSNEPNGIYFATVLSKDKRLIRKLIKQ